MSWSESWWITRNIVKSVQRGTTSGAQTVTINAVNMEKSFVISTSKGSAGYVAARGKVAKANINIPYKSYTTSTSDLRGYMPGGDGNQYFPPLSGTVSATSIRDGSTDLTTKQYSAQLISSTQLQCDGAVEWQVIEFY